MLRIAAPHSYEDDVAAKIAVVNVKQLAPFSDREDDVHRTQNDEKKLTAKMKSRLMVPPVRAAAWTELDNVDAAKKFTDRQPLITSLRRNLQREHIDRVMDLANNKLGNAPAAKPISDLAAGQLAELRDKLSAAAGNANLDNYTRSHLRENAARITKMLEARYVMVK